MAKIITNLLNKRRNRTSEDSEDSTSSPEHKKTRTTKQLSEEEDEIWTALNMSETVAGKLEEILKKLQKLDVIEASVKNIEVKLKNLEERTDVLEKDIKDLKDGADFTSTQVDKQTTELTNAKAEIAKLTKTVNENEEGRKEMETKLLYLEAYSRRENIKFMNIAVDSTEEREDAEETLRSFLERDLGLLDARSVEIQRVHRSGKGKDGGPRPILARFLRYKDVQKIFSLGHRLKDTDYQMFRDYPAEIVKRRKEQMKTFKEARKNGIPAAFSQSQPDKLYIRGRLWPVGRELII